MKCEVQVSLQKGKVWARSNKRYVGIAWSSRRGKTSLIFKLLQESKVRIYTTVKRSGETEGTSLVRQDGTQGLYMTLKFRTTRQ